MAVTGDLPPMDYVGPDDQPAGFNVAILSELSRRIGKNIELVPVTAAARAMALASNQVDVVFWSRSCMGVQEAIDNDMDWMELFEIEDAEDEAGLAMADESLLPLFDYTSYAGKDIPKGLVVTACYYTDSIVLVTKQ